MKKFLPFWTLMISGMFVFVSCDDENGDPNHGNSGNGKVPQEILEAFNRDYNGAKADWEVRGNYAIADLENSEQSVWYDMTTYIWGIEETEIQYASLPAAIKTAFESSPYKDWRKSDVDLLKRNNAETLYVIEAESGKQEINLYYTEDGVLVHEAFDNPNDQNDYSGYFPQSSSDGITNWIKQNYPNARIVDVDKGSKGTEVEIIDNHTKYEIMFDSSDAWLQTKTEYGRHKLPTEVTDFVKANYSEWRIDDVDLYETKDKTYYQIELEGTNDFDKTIFLEKGGGEISRPDNGNNIGDSPSTGTGSDFQKVINEKYPGAIILGNEYDDGYREITIRHEEFIKEVKLDYSGKWILTEWEIPRRKCPEKVSKILADNGFTLTDDDIEAVETAKGTRYEMEGIKNHREYDIYIDEEDKLTFNDD